MIKKPRTTRKERRPKLDIYYAILTPSQAALMLHGIPPPAPKETASLMREIFVHKEKLLQGHIPTQLIYISYFLGQQ